MEQLCHVYWYPIYAFVRCKGHSPEDAADLTQSFFAKLLVLKSAVAGGFLWVAIVAAVCAVIGAYYYLRVIKVMYFDEASSAPEVQAPLDVKAVLCANALALLALGIFWSPLAQLCSQLWTGG